MSAVNFYLEDTTIAVLDQMSTVLGINRSQALRHSIGAGAALLQAAQHQSVARLQALRQEFGDDRVLTVGMTEDEDGEPRAMAFIDGQVEEGVHATARLIGNQVYVMLELDPPKFGRFAPEVFVNFANTGVFAPDVSLPLGALPWPPDPTKGFVFRLGDVESLVAAEHLLSEPIGA